MPKDLLSWRSMHILRFARDDTPLSAIDSDLLTFDNSTPILRPSSTGARVTTSSPDLLQGTLDLLILRVLALGPLHGWGLSQRIREISEDTLRVNQGSLYPALHRLEGQRLLDAEWIMSDTFRRVKCYMLTTAGRRHLARVLEPPLRFARAVHLILNAT
jgi:transcriptional regulator